MKYFWAFMAILLLAGGWVWWEASVFLRSPGQSEGKEVYFDVPQGASFTQVANDLAARGIITDARKFRFLARLKSQDQKLQAGRFALNSGWLPERVLDQLVNGKPALYRITVPEGLTWWQTARLLEEGGFARFDDFRDVIADPDFLRHYGIPFSTAEGFLMPDTYLFKKPESTLQTDGSKEGDPGAEREWRKQARNVAGRMVDNFWRKAEPVLKTGLETPDINFKKRADLKKIIILASIVEKETGLDKERGRVAGVYANRIAKNMLLQADPTVIYGLGPDFSGQLRRSQLEDPKNAYNTYQNGGLPPGPIASFGIAALKAAVQPEKHDFIYFVAKTDGGEHTFSRTLEEHNRAVGEYRRQKKAR